MKIIFTGGHFSPAYAVIKKLRKDDEVLVIGRRHAFEGDINETYEYRLCAKENIPFVAIKAGRLQRKFTRFTLGAALRFPSGIYTALKILRRENPDIIVTFGGYVGLAVSLAASILHIPIVLHEQTQKAGLSAKLISRFASVVLLSFETSKMHLHNKNVKVVGNPLRDELYKTYDFPKFHSNKPLIYITGGSAGAHSINLLIGKILPELTSEYFVVHQAGAQETNDIVFLEDLREKLPEECKKNYVIKKFYSPEEVSYLLRNSQLVVSRSGINTVLELMTLGVVALLIPLPGGQQNEQEENARLYVSTGLGEYFKQDKLSPEMLLQKMRVMIKEQKKYRQNHRNAIKFIHNDATDKIIEQIYYYGRGEKGRSSNSPEKT